ncbi:MAG TPA: hypothetical protein VJO72_09765, partial [Candidatus Dormibacteraeota bacterium]|nr:hypothetical protein [Candidatus Dormibacteraeota bacterium]
MPRPKRRRPTAGLILISGLVLAAFLAVRMVPEDTEVGPFKLEWGSGWSALQAALFQAHDPGEAFWLIIKVVTTPPRVVWAPTTPAPRVALAQPAPSPSALAPAGNPSPTPRPT